jgi:hypothetical protein
MGHGKPARIGFFRWRRDGTWDRILAHAQTHSDAVGEIVWEVSVDSSTPGIHLS